MRDSSRSLGAQTMCRRVLVMLTRFMRLLGLPILLAACTAYGQDR